MRKTLFKTIKTEVKTTTIEEKDRKLTESKGGRIFLITGLS